MKEFNNEEFRIKVETHKELFLLTFKPSFEENEKPTSFALDEHGKLHTRLSELHNSDIKLNTQYFRIRNAKQKKKSLTIADVIQSDCLETGDDLSTIFNFAAEIVALDELKEYVYKLAKPNLVETVTKSDFTNARKVLMFYYLIEAAKDNTEYVIVDKTVIARFIELIGFNKESSKKISNSNIYDVVKEYYGTPEKASKKDLIFIKEKFSQLGIIGIVKNIQKLIDKK
jgi:hypothetical protein